MITMIMTRNMMMFNLYNPYDDEDCRLHANDDVDGHDCDGDVGW